MAKWRRSGIVCMVLFFLMALMTACSENVSGTYYEWSYAEEGNGKIVLGDDGKCLFYAIMAEDNSEETLAGEYAESDNGVMVFLDMGESFELTKEDDYYIFDGNSDSRWYRDREKAIEEWEKVFYKNNQYIENHIYYQCEYDPVFNTNMLYFLCVTNLDSKGNAEYEIYNSDAYDSETMTELNAKNLWENKKHSIEKGILSFGYNGDQGHINSDSDFLPNYKYNISMDGVVDSIYLNDEDPEYFSEWIAIDSQ